MSYTNPPWGWHVSVDFIGAPLELITNPENFENFVNCLCEATGMKRYGDMQAYHFATHDPDKAGYSFNVFQETSNICGHLIDKNGGGFIDCFSCKPYNREQVESIVKGFFKPTMIKSNMVTRTYPTES